MADPYDPNDPDDERGEEREQASYDQEEAAQQRQMLAPSSSDTGVFDPSGSGQPVAQAIPTQAPPLQAAAQPAPQQVQQQFETFDYNPTGQPQQEQQQQPAPPAQLPQQPQQPQQRPLAPYPGGGVAARPSRGDRAAADRQARFGTIISDETFDVSPEVMPQPTGGLGTVVAVEFMNFGHDMLSLANIAGKQLGLSTQALEAMNAQFKEHIDKVRDGLDPERRAAQDVSIFDPSSFAGKDAGAVAEAYAVTLFTGIASGLGPGLAAKVATKTAARVAGRAGSTAAGATAAEQAAAATVGTVSDVAAIGTAGAVGGVQQSGARYSDYAATIDKMTAEDKQKSAMYQQYRAQNMSDAEALEAMKQQFPTLQQLGVNFLGATGLAAVTPGLGGVLPRLTSRARNAAAGAAEAGGSVGAATGASAAIQEQSKVAAGTQPAINWGQVGAEAGVGALAGGAAGAVFGGMRAGRPAEPVRPPPADPGATPPAGQLALPAPDPMLALPPPSTLALPAPPAMPGRRDTVTPGGVPPEHTAALNAAGIGRQAVETEPGAQQFRPRGPDPVTIGRDESFFAPPPRAYDLPAGTVLPPADPTAWRGPPPPLAPDTGPRLLTASPERGAGFTMRPTEPGPALLTASPERGPGFEIQQPGAAVRAYEQPIGPPAASAIPPAGPPLLTASRERGPGFEVQQPGAAVRAYEQPIGPPTPPPPLAPDTGPRRLTASPERGEGFTVQQPGAAVRAYAEPIDLPTASAIPPAGPPRLTAARERGEGFTVREPEAAPQQITASRERGEGFVTEPPPAAPRPSEGLSANQLDQRLADYGLTKQQRSRLVGKEKKAAALDKLEQEARARGEEPPKRGAGAQREKEPAPATPRGAESREQPAPAARPSEGMSHQALGKALQDKGLSKREVNQILTKEARAFAYDKIVRDEEAALSRIGEKEQGENVVRTVMEAGPDETKGHPVGEAEDRRWRALKPERTADGKYKGAPEWVKTPRDYKKLQRLIKQLVNEGKKGRYWYEDSAREIIKITRGNLADAERIMGLIAIYSPQRPVFTNMGFAVKAYRQWKAGEPIKVNTGRADENAYNWLEHGQDWGGRKTDNFYLNLMHELVTSHPNEIKNLRIPDDVLSEVKKVTVDVWVLRALGYNVDQAGTGKGEGTKFAFSERELQRLAGELNLSVPQGEQRWLPHQVQAALWSAVKARFEVPGVKLKTNIESHARGFSTKDEKGYHHPESGEKKVGHMGIWRRHAMAASPEDVALQVESAKGSFADAIGRTAQHVTVEAIPSKSVGHAINNASREAQEQFTREAHALLLDDDGNNLLAQKVGVDLGYDTYGSGSFEGKVSPNIIASLVPVKPAGFFDRTKARMYARASQYIYMQDAVPFFRADAAHKFGTDFHLVGENGEPVRTASGAILRYRTQAEAQALADRRSAGGEPTTIGGRDVSHGAFLTFKQALDEAGEQRLLAAIQREINHSDAGFTRVGDNEAVIINFRGDDGLPFIADDVAFGRAVDRIVADPDIGVASSHHFGSEAEYGTVHTDWTEGPGGRRSDAARAVAAAAGGSPDFQAWVRDRHAAFGKLLDDWSDPEARYAASRPGDGGGTGPLGRSSLELPEARAPPSGQAARERAADQRAARVEATPEAEAPAAPSLERPFTEASRAQRDQPTASESPLSRVMKDDRVNAPVREAIDRGGSLHDGLRAIANNPYINKRLPHVAAYARSMLRLAPDLELRPSETVRRGAFVSEEDLNTGRRSEHIEVREKSAEVLLHEATHTVVGHYVDSLQPGSREFQVLTTIRDEFRRGAEAHGRLGDEQVAYALSNPHELHAMLRTNPEMHDLMRGIVPTAEYRARMAQLGYPVGPAKSLWQSFVRFIRQALHLPQNVTSLMDHVMRPLDDIAEAGARFNRDPASAYTRESMVYRRGWERQRLHQPPRVEAVDPFDATTRHELPSFSDARDRFNEFREGRAGNVGSGFRRAVRQVMPTHQLTGFNRHLFNSSQPGVGNHADNLTRAAEGVENASREYAEGKVGPDWLPNANGKPREQAFREQNDQIDAATGLALTKSSRIDTHPAYPRDHALNSHSRATPAQFAELQADYRNLTTAQRQVFNDTFAMQRQLRVDEGDAALRGIGKTYLHGVTDTQVETLVRQMRTMAGVNDILANVDTNPVARAFGSEWVGNRDFVKAIATEWKRGWINNYVPLHRSGDWVVNYTDPQTGEKGMISRYTMREAENARLQLEVDGAEPSLVLSRERRRPTDIPRLTIVDKFEAKLQANPTLNPDQVTAARDLLTKVLLDQSRFAGRNRERLGVHGADPTKLKEAMAQRFQALKNSVGHLEYGPQYEAGLNAMDRHVKEMGRASGTVRIPDISGERAATNADAIQAQQYMEEMRRRKPISEDANTLLTKTAHNATMLTYFKFLASPAQTFMNGLDTYVQGIPRIGATFGIGRATAAMARASAEIMPRQFARGLVGTGQAARGRLDPGEWNSAQQIRDHLIAGSRRNDVAGMTALFQRMQDGNLIGYSSYRDLQAMAKGGNSWIRQKADMAADMVSILHNKMEDANRATVALAAYDVHFRKNGDRAAAVDYAEKTLRTAMPNFGLSNKPRFATAQGGFGVWGIPVAQFRQHGMWAYSQMALDIRNAFKGADAATKTEARYALAFTIGMQTVLFGALNWLADPLRYLWGAYDWLSGGRPQDHSHDFRQYAAKLFGVTGGQFVSRGVLGAAGYGPYTVERMGLINAALVPKMEGDWKNPKDVTYAAMTAVAGVPAMGAATEIITGLSNFAAGNYQQAAMDLLPKILRDPIKAYTGETEGQISRRGNVLQTPEQISALDTVYQVLGFKSARQGERSEQTGSQRQLIAEAAASRQAATRDAAHALINGSASERRAADQAIKAHNKAYPGSQIDPKDVFNYRKREVERLRDPSLTGITVPKAMQPAVRQVGAFANY